VSFEIRFLALHVAQFGTQLGRTLLGARQPLKIYERALRLFHLVDLVAEFVDLI